MKPEVINEEPLCMSEARKALKGIKKRDEELSFRAAKTDEYLGQMTILGERAAAELRQKLLDLDIPRFKEEHIAKIVDLLPYTKEDVKLILSGYTLTIKDANVKKILDTIEEYRK